MHAIANCNGLSPVAGNVLGGSFDLTWTPPGGSAATATIPFDASEVSMKTKLEALTGIGTVAVTRSAADPQLGYSW